VLFPTWHRPYVALHEVRPGLRCLTYTTVLIDIIQQLLQQHAIAIAKTYKTDQQKWLAAAQNLRAPYWDWATKSVPPREVYALQTVNIITPDGKTTAVTNPLYQYNFNPIDPSFPAPYKAWRTTIRNPDNPSSPNATTNSADLAQYDFTFPDSSLSHSFFSIKGTWRRSRVTSPQVPTIFCRVFILGPLSVTTRRAMVVALVTLWKPYTTRFMVSLAVRWVTRPLRVGCFCVLSFLVMPDAIYLQDLILFSSCITATLIVFSPFGRQLIPESGFRGVQPTMETGLSQRMFPSTPVLVC
jgi:hypothetical protein